MNTMNYLLLNYNNAPCIKQLDDHSIISKDFDDMIKNLMYYYDKDKLDKYIGDLLITYYKKDNPETQSIWSSDTDRLNYFIREFLKERENKSQWTLDKKGIKMTKYIIKPLLDYIMIINNNYINEKNKEILELSDEQDDNLIRLGNMQKLASINTLIKNNKLSNGINKYIAPHFYLDKK